MTRVNITHIPPLICTGEVDKMQNLACNGSDFEKEQHVGNSKQTY